VNKITIFKYKTKLRIAQALGAIKNINMKKIFILFTILIIAQLTYGQKQPNVVYILVDNWGWGDVSIQGSITPTPQIDNLATEGFRFTNFNVQNQCTPTRSALMTGRLPIRSGTQKRKK